MSLYQDYLQEIETRKATGLNPKPIDDGALIGEIIEQIKDPKHPDREQSLNFFTYNTLPGTTSAAGVKAKFLKEVILGETSVADITSEDAFEWLSHMKGGPSVEALLDMTLGDNADIAQNAAEVLKTQVFLYDADTKRLVEAYEAGNKVAADVLNSYAQAEFYTKLPEVDETIGTVAYVAQEGDITTDLLSPGKEAHSRADRELHGQSMISPKAQAEIQALQEKHPDKRVMIIAEKGTMGTGSSRMSGVNNVALWTGKQASPYIPFVNNAPIVAGTFGVAPIFGVTVDVTGGIGLALNNWVKKEGPDGEVIMGNDGKPLLEQTYSVETGDVLSIDMKNEVLRDEAGKELVGISSSLTPQKQEFMRAGGSYEIVFGKRLQALAAETVGVEPAAVFAPAKIVSHEGQGLTAVEKIFNQNAIGVPKGTTLHAGSDATVKVNIVGSQDTTGPMTVQELEAMAAPEVWDDKAKANTPKLMQFMNDFGLITGRDPKGEYPIMTDVIHKVLNDLTVSDWDIIVGGDSHTRMSKGVAFGADSGTVALALATGQATMPIPKSVKVTFKGEMKSHMDFRDVVHATQAQMLEQTGGDNVFQGNVIEVHLGTLEADQAFAFTDWTAEMKAKASVCISTDEALMASLETAQGRIQDMINKGMDNEAQTLKGLFDKAAERIEEIKSGTKPALRPDEDAQYASEIVVDLDQIDEPKIADPDVNNPDPSQRYTHDNIRDLSDYQGEKPVDLGFVGSCMVHKGDIKIVAQMLKNIESKEGKVEFKAPLVLAAPTNNIIDELKAEGDWEILQRYSGYEYDPTNFRLTARTEFENQLYLEPPGCNLCMGNQEKAAKGDTVMATSTRLFEGRVVADSDVKKGESLLASTPVVVLSAVLGRVPTLEEYKEAVADVELTRFVPPEKALTGNSLHF